MTRSLFLLISVFFLGITYASAQNKILVLEPGDSIGNKVRLPRGMHSGYYEGGYLYNIAQPPADVVKGLPVNCELITAANQSVNRFQCTHLSNGYVDLGRDFLDMNYTWTHDMDYDGASWRMMSKKDSIMNSKVKKTLFTDKIVQEAIYRWLAPAYLDAYSIMSVPEQKAYIKMFEEGIAFADTFNLATQKQIVENSDNYANTVGSLNAFIYRRVVNKELTRQDCKTWMNRILSDLRKNEKQNPSPADELVLTGSLGYGYYSAADYTGANGYESEFSVLRRKEDEFEILPIPKFQYGNYDVPETSFFRCFTYDDTYQRYLFYCDSTGYSFAKTSYEEDLKGFTFLGAGMSARVLMIYYYNFEYQDAQCENAFLTMAAVVDLDSGYIVHDSVGIVECHTYSDWESTNVSYPTLNSSRIVFYCYSTGRYGVMDRTGNILLPPNYTSVEFTTDPDVVKVNGKKLVSVFGGGKPAKKKKAK